MILVACLALALIVHEWAFLFVALGVGYRLWKRDASTEPRQGLAFLYGYRAGKRTSELVLHEPGPVPVCPARGLRFLPEQFRIQRRT